MSPGRIEHGPTHLRPLSLDDRSSVPGQSAIRARESRDSVIGGGLPLPTPLADPGLRAAPDNVGGTIEHGIRRFTVVNATSRGGLVQECSDDIALTMESVKGARLRRHTEARWIAESARTSLPGSANDDPTGGRMRHESGRGGLDRPRGENGRSVMQGVEPPTITLRPDGGGS